MTPPTPAEIKEWLDTMSDVPEAVIEAMLDAYYEETATTWLDTDRKRMSAALSAVLDEGSIVTRTEMQCALSEAGERLDAAVALLREYDDAVAGWATYPWNERRRAFLSDDTHRD